MKTIEKVGAQGDVLFRKIAALPPGLKRHEEKGPIVIAHSETGHHHTVEETAGVYYTDPKSSMIAYLQLGDGCTAFGGADVVHHRPTDTHETMRLLGMPGDVFEIRRQREWSPEGWRRVED
jgi:hypothetical protein